MTVLQNTYFSAESDLAFTHFSAEYESSTANKKPALLLMHGWANSSVVWSVIIPQLEKHFRIYSFDLPGHGRNAALYCETIDDFYALYHRSIHAHLPSSYIILGWSLGGTLGSLLAKKYHKSVSALITIATNPVFVARECWPEAMPASMIDEFYTGLIGQCDKYVKRFWLLQSQGVDTGKHDLRWLKANMAGIHYAEPGLCAGLNWLKSIDLLDCWRNLKVPVLHHYGVEDSIVPIEVAKKVEALFPEHKVFRYRASAHMPFVSEQEEWLQCFYASMIDNGFIDVDIINDDIVAASNEERQIAAIDKNIDKAFVAKSFSRAAMDYDELAVFQMTVGKHLLLSLPEVAKKNDVNVLDLGSGTGFMARHFAEKQGGCNTVELDIAEGMLQRSQALSAKNKIGDQSYIQADIESLPVVDNYFDLILSNLSLQWCENFQAVFFEVDRVLQVDGVFGFTTVLPGSLLEIQQAWSGLDCHQHINTFCSECEVRKKIKSQGLQVMTWEVAEHKDYFSSIEALLKSVKGIGAGNHLARRAKGLMGKEKYRDFLNALALRCKHLDRYALSYNILTAVLKKVEKNKVEC